MISTYYYYYYCFFDLPLLRLGGDINGSKASINCDTFCLLSLFFFLLDLAVDEVDADGVEPRCLFFAIASFSSGHRICDCTVAEGLKSRRLEISADLYFKVAVEAEADDDDLTETDDDDCSEIDSCERLT